jgi:hypothetical protein
MGIIKLHNSSTEPEVLLTVEREQGYDNKLCNGTSMYEQYFIIWAGQPVATGHGSAVPGKLCKGIGKHEDHPKENNGKFKKSV